MVRVRSVLWLVALTGCYEAVPQAQYDEEIPDLAVRLDALEAELAALQAENAALAQRVETLESESGVTCPGGCVGQDDLAAYVTDAEAAEFLVAADLSGVEGRLAALEAIDPLTLAEAEVWIAAKGFALGADLDVLAAQVAALDLLTLAEVQAWVGAQGYATESWVGARGYATQAALQSAEDRLDLVEGDYVVHAELTPFARQTQADDLDARLGQIEAGYLRPPVGDVAVRVPSDQPDVASAITWLEGLSLLPGARAEVVLEEGTHRVTRPVVAHLSAGATLHVHGIDGADGRVFLDAVDCNAVEVSSGSSPMTLDHVNVGGDGSSHIGVRVYDGGELRLGEGVRIEDFGLHGLVVERGSTVFGDGGPFVGSNGGYGVWVTGGSLAWLGPVQVVDNGYSGLTLDHSSFALADGAYAEGNDHGFYVNGNSMLRALDADAVENRSHGFATSTRSYLEASNSSALDNGMNGYVLALGSVSVAVGSTAAGNTVGYDIKDGSFGSIAFSTSTDNEECGFEADVAGAWDALPSWTALRNGPSGEDHYCEVGMVPELDGAAIASALCGELDPGNDLDVYRIQADSTGNARCAAESVRGGGGPATCLGVVLTYSYADGAEVGRRACDVALDLRTNGAASGAWACCAR